MKPCIHHTESTDDTETDFSGKVGASVGINEDLAVYGEISGISDEDASGDDLINWGGKIGAVHILIFKQIRLRHRLCGL